MKSAIQESRRLTGQVQSARKLTSQQREEMYVLMSHYFANVSRPHFERDLAEKEWVILLKDSVSARIQGFSTLMRLFAIVDNQPVVAFYSGDTIVDRRYWQETELPRLWSRHVFALADQIRNARVYWYLISSGYKTYRFLPVFFREFYPTYRRPTPDPVLRILNRLGTLKFSSEYDSASGIVRFAHAVPLRSEVAEIAEQRLKDPHVAFFLKANPRHHHGDQLTCLTELCSSNLTAAGLRMLGL